jgi:cob(I)alamin adenosyltransferase
MIKKSKQVLAMQIYTRKGDYGKTSLLGGLRVAKTDQRVKTYGAVDELQAQLGMARAEITDQCSGEIVLNIQRHLLTAGAFLAATPTAAAKLAKQITSDHVDWMENIIDSLTTAYGLPQGFILPGNDRQSAAMHIARAMCRRCERLICMLYEKPDGDCYQDLVIYFNRLSDLLFVLAWALEVRALIKKNLRALLDEKSKKGS